MRNRYSLVYTRTVARIPADQGSARLESRY